MRIADCGRLPVHLFELHHQMLAALPEFSSASGSAVEVLSFDHHTDILPEFSRARRRADFTPPATLDKAIGLLAHDEHFDYALKHGLARRVLIASHTPGATPHDPRLIVLPGAVLDESVPVNAPEASILFDRALETDFLREKLSDIRPEAPYIIDMDLDYFKSRRSLEPRDPEYFFSLLRGACGITVSLESDWVKLLGSDLTDAQEALRRFLKLANKAFC